ncbi:hypothetical protein DUNSADRAFT_4054 [Dunaliella salina]|uniref:USP domain-containing protein n=1 Tax=Dunaliella salina TaxID=3046 RepID=A0ABQ7GSU9_DUNSA|nr:hypothetical protein DUNSADRAFT_4054 [Dunaliella salina]|eukprot:KAF5837689.1 hypothetical protein DUNSADRAFT_4054 [Dunaliella salina]
MYRSATFALRATPFSSTGEAAEVAHASLCPSCPSLLHLPPAPPASLLPIPCPCLCPCLWPMSPQRPSLSNRSSCALASSSCGWARIVELVVPQGPRFSHPWSDSAHTPCSWLLSAWVAFSSLSLRIAAGPMPCSVDGSSSLATQETFLEASGLMIGVVCFVSFFVDGPGEYELVGFISHMGSNTSCGHYVAHIRVDGRWVIYNDEKVAESEHPPLDLGYMYMFKRVDV